MPLPYVRETPRPSPADAPPPPEPGFWEQAFAAARVASDETDDAQLARVDAAYRDLAEALKERGYDEKSLSREAKWYRLEPGFRIDYEKVKAAVDRERQRDPNAFKAVGPDWAQFEQNVRARNGGRAADQSVLARGTGVTSVAAGIVGGTASDVDNGPLGPLTFMVGAGGPSVLWRILGEGVINATQELVVTPERMRGRAALGEPMTATDAAVGVAEAFAGGVLFAGAGEGFGRFVLPKSQAAFEKVVASNWDRLPEGLRTRWEARATLDPTQADRLLADVSEQIIGTDRLTQAQADALAVIRREADIDGANPFVPNGAGETAHLDAIAQTVARIMADEPATKPAFVPPAAGGALPGRGSGATAIASGTVAGDAPARFMQRVRAAESSGNDAAAASTTSAFGRYQFTKNTWIAYFTKRFGTMGLTRAEILAKRADGRLQDLLMGDLTADNAARLQRIGAPVTEGNLYLAHFLGPADAEKVLRASPETPLEGLISPASIAANESVLKGRTAGDVLAFADRKMGSAGSRGDGLHLRPDAGVEPALRAQIDAELAQVRAETARIEEELRAQGVDVEAELAAIAPEAELRPVEAMPEPVVPEPPRWRPPEERGPFDIRNPPHEVVALKPAIKQLVEDKSRNLNDFATLADELGVPEVDLRNAMLIVAKEKGSGLSIRRKDGRYIRRPIVFGAKAANGGPEDVLEFIARNGGIRVDEGHSLGLKGLSAKQRGEMISDGARRRAELARQGGDRGWKMMTRHNGPLLRHEGRSIDQVGELLWEAGYLTGRDGGRPTAAEVLTYLDQRIGEGKPMFTMADQAAARDAQGIDPEWDAQLAQEALQRAMDEVRWAATDVLDVFDHTLDTEFLTHAAKLRMADPELSPEQAVINAVNDYSTAAMMDALDESGDLKYEDFYGNDPEYRPEDFPREAGDPGPAPDPRDAQASGSFADPAAGSENAGRVPLEDLPREEAGRFLDPEGEAAKAQSDALEHDARMAIEPPAAPATEAVASKEGEAVSALQAAIKSNQAQAVIERKAKPDVESVGEANIARIQAILGADQTVAATLPLNQTAESFRSGLTHPITGYFTESQAAQTVQIGKMIAQLAGKQEVGRIDLAEAASYVDAARKMAASPTPGVEPLTATKAVANDGFAEVAQSRLGSRADDTYTAADVGGLTKGLAESVARIDGEPQTQVTILDAIERGLIPDGDMLMLGSPRWALERGYADIGPTDQGRRGRITEAGRQKLAELRGEAPANGLDLGAAVDPNMAARTRQQLELRAQQPMSAGVKGGQATGIAQNGTLPEGLFGGAEAPKFDVGDGDGPTDLKGLFDKLDGEANDLGTIKGCMVPKPKGNA